MISLELQQLSFVNNRHASPIWDAASSRVPVFNIITSSNGRTPTARSGTFSNITFQWTWVIGVIFSGISFGLVVAINGPLSSPYCSKRVWRQRFFIKSFVIIFCIDIFSILFARKNWTGRSQEYLGWSLFAIGLSLCSQFQSTGSMLSSSSLSPVQASHVLPVGAYLKIIAGRFS